MTDPDEMLGQIRRLLDEDAIADPELADQVAALDQHLSAGGRLPMSWAQAHRPTMEVHYSGGSIAVPMDEPEPLGGPVPGTNGWHLPEDDDA